MTVKPRSSHHQLPVVVRAPNWLGRRRDGAARAGGDPCGRVPDATDCDRGRRPSVAPLFEDEIALRRQRRAFRSLHAAEAADAEEDTTADERGRWRTGKFDAALLLPNSFRSAWTARRAGIPERWGYAANLRGRLLTRAVARPTPGRSISPSTTASSCAVSGSTLPEALPRVRVRPETARRAGALLAADGVDGGAPLVGFAPGAAYGHAKRWPPRAGRRGGRRACRRSGARSACSSAPQATAMPAREIESALPRGRPAVVNLIGRTDLRLLAGVLARCAAFVSNDSGAMHLAAAVGVPVDGDLRADRRSRHRAARRSRRASIHQVFCRPCMLRDCPIDHRCMKGITADAVVRRRRGAGSSAAGRRITMTMKPAVFLDRDGTLLEEAGYLDGSSGSCSFLTASMPSGC